MPNDVAEMLRLKELSWVRGGSRGFCVQPPTVKAYLAGSESRSSRELAEAAGCREDRGASDLSGIGALRQCGWFPVRGLSPIDARFTPGRSGTACSRRSR
jgi:hypothetical protein